MAEAVCWFLLFFLSFLVFTYNRVAPAENTAGTNDVESPLNEDELESSSLHPQVCDLGYQFRSRLPVLEANTMNDAKDAVLLCAFFRLDPTAKVTTVENTLRVMVDDNMLQVKNEQKDNGDVFLPLDAFERIFCTESIKALVKEKYGHVTETRQLAIFKAIDGRRRILATLLMMGKLELLPQLVDAGISDVDLPLILPILDSIQQRENPPLLLSKQDRINFRIYQYQFLVPYFSIQNDPHFYNVKHGIHMPWISFEVLKSGQSRDVHRVQIHPEHHNFKSPGNPYFALKRVTDASFEGELQALQKHVCIAYKTKHLVNLLLAIKQDDQRYLLFECADGDLSDFWGKCGNGNPPKRTSTVHQKWAAQQCLGLATALKLIHGRATLEIRKREERKNVSWCDWGRHGDVKPQNILWYASRPDDEETNLLVLSDLGSTRFHTRDSRSDIPNAGDFTPRYGAPEVNTIQRVSRKSDIWSLGCVFLEFCIWWLEGNHEVVKFVDDCTMEYDYGSKVKYDRYFRFDKTRRKVQVKQAVGKMISQLRRNHHRDPFARNLLRLVKDHMIVLDTSKRAGIDFICVELQRIVSLLEKEGNQEDQDGSDVVKMRHRIACKFRTFCQAALGVRLMDK